MRNLKIFMHTNYDSMLMPLRQALNERGETITIQPIAEHQETNAQRGCRVEIHGNTVWRFLKRLPLSIGDTIEAGKELFIVTALAFYTFPTGENVTFVTTRLLDQKQSQE